ncbi:hypothetical protein CAOG_08559, partial [Capsaspora owczarzaki ATCC 30864]
MASSSPAFQSRHSAPAAWMAQLQLLQQQHQALGAQIAHLRNHTQPVGGDLAGSGHHHPQPQPQPRPQPQPQDEPSLMSLQDAPVPGAARAAVVASLEQQQSALALQIAQLLKLLQPQQQQPAQHQHGSWPTPPGSAGPAMFPSHQQLSVSSSGAGSGAGSGVATVAESARIGSSGGHHSQSQSALNLPFQHNPFDAPPTSPVFQTTPMQGTSMLTGGAGAGAVGGWQQPSTGQPPVNPFEIPHAAESTALAYGRGGESRPLVDGLRNDRNDSHDVGIPPVKSRSFSFNVLAPITGGSGSSGSPAKDPWGENAGRQSPLRSARSSERLEENISPTTTANGRLSGTQSPSGYGKAALTSMSDTIASAASVAANTAAAALSNAGSLVRRKPSYQPLDGTLLASNDDDDDAQPDQEGADAEHEEHHDRFDTSQSLGSWGSGLRAAISAGDLFGSGARYRSISDGDSTSSSLGAKSSLLLGSNSETGSQFGRDASQPDAFAEMHGSFGRQRIDPLHPPPNTPLVLAPARSVAPPVTPSSPAAFPKAGGGGGGGGADQLGWVSSPPLAVSRSSVDTSQTNLDDDYQPFASSTRLTRSVSTPMEPSFNARKSLEAFSSSGDPSQGLAVNDAWTDSPSSRDSRSPISELNAVVSKTMGVLKRKGGSRYDVLDGDD